MEEMQYIGEHLLPRYLGEIVTIGSFSAILFATIAFALSVKNQNDVTYKKAGRVLFGVHSGLLLSMMGLLFYVLFNRYFEYAYAYEHASRDLPTIYIFCGFWEGQQGSFLLWMFWHVVLGWIAIKKLNEWEPGVLLGIGLMQTWLASMLLGIHLPFTEFKIGNNPLMLLRETMGNIPLFANEDYLSLIDGQGLNLLLQNYWNVIHPPITFLGFASVTIPFAFALTGLLTNNHKDWLKPALPWVLFSAGMLGVGILMGSAWAYEALTFGGYWAWDPVENMSLVPWIMLIAGIHAHLIAQSTGHTKRSVYLFYMLAFCLSIYSTYLVRSGALEDTSVHAFTEMGMGAQLTSFLLFFVLGSAFLLIRQWKKISVPEKEESAYSREFWMFIGLMILAISSILITYSTSLPVINNIVRVFKPDYVGQVIQDANEHYNKYQLWIAVFIAFLSGLAQWFRYRNEKPLARSVLIRMAVHGLLTIVSTLLISSILQHPTLSIKIMLAAALYCTISNVDYLISRIKGNWRMWGSVLSHAGFGIMLLGIIFSGINKRYITKNPTLMSGLFSDLDDESLMRNVVLLKNEPIYSQGYMLEYERDSFIGTERKYIVSFKKLDESGKSIDSFALMPNVVFNKQFDNIEAFHPGIKRAMLEDVFVRIADLPKAEVDPKFAQAIEDTLSYTTYSVRLGDSIDLADHIIHVNSTLRNPSNVDIPTQPGDKIVGLGVVVTSKKSNETFPLILNAILRGNLSYILPEKLSQEELRLKVSDTILLPYLSFQEFNETSSEQFVIKEKERFEFQGHTITFNGFIKSPEHAFYTSVENDIAIGAELTIDGKTIQPVYVIRGNEVRQVNDYDPYSGVLVQFTKLNPTSEELTISVKKLDPTIHIKVADNVSRTDFLVLEAVAFPGINLFWIGSIIMLLGVFLSGWVRRKMKRA